jgi:predicted XRE-type DNA-binding protein
MPAGKLHAAGRLKRSEFMNAEQRKALEAEGYKVYDHAGDAVGLTEEEKQLMDIRITLAISVRNRREKLQLSQQDLALRLKTSQPRVAKIERAAHDVSFDQIVRAYVALGGRMLLTELETRSGNGLNGGAKPGKKKASKR